MQRFQAFKFELIPKGEQALDMRRFAGARRFVFNKALDSQQKTYATEKKQLSFAQLCKHFVAWKQEFAWRKEAPSQALQQSFKDLDKAWQNFFAQRAAFPKFKKKGRCESFRFPQGFKIDQLNSRIKLPKLGWIRYRNSRDILGTAKNITVSQSGSKWFASIQTEREVEMPVPMATSAIGIDVGIARFAAMSDGNFIKPLNNFKKHEKRLAKYQRRNEHFGAGIPRCSLWRGRLWPGAQAKDETSLSEAGTHRSDFNQRNAG